MSVSTEADLLTTFPADIWLGERRQYIRCRTIGHSWFDYDSNWKPEFGIPMTLRCERCGTERRDTINEWGTLLARHYYKPANYDRARGEDSLTRSDFRVLLLRIREEDAMKKGRRR